MVQGCIQRKTGSERFWLMILYWSNFCVLLSIFDSREGLHLMTPEKGDLGAIEEGFCWGGLLGSDAANGAPPGGATWKLAVILAGERGSIGKELAAQKRTWVGCSAPMYKFGTSALESRRQEVPWSLLASHVSRISSYLRDDVSKANQQKTRRVVLGEQHLGVDLWPSCARMCFSKFVRLSLIWCQMGFQFCPFNSLALWAWEMTKYPMLQWPLSSEWEAVIVISHLCPRLSSVVAYSCRVPNPAYVSVLYIHTYKKVVFINEAQ